MIIAADDDHHRSINSIRDILNADFSDGFFMHCESQAENMGKNL